MNLRELQVSTNSKGEISCGDIEISSAEWYQLLKQPKAEAYLKELFCILQMPEHKASCKMLSEKFGQNPQHYNSKILAFSRWVQDYLNRFRVLRPGGKDCYWVIPMAKGMEEGNGFVWYLRDELSKALQQFLIEKLISEFKQRCLKNTFKESGEINKWEVINHDINASTLDIIKSLKGVNFVSNTHVDGILKFFVENRPDEITTCVNHLFEESKDLDNRLLRFKDEMRELAAPGSKKFANDERTAAALLTCKYPDNYTIYMDTVYQLICRYLGIETQSAGHKYSHFLNIIHGISNKYGEEIEDIIKEDIRTFEIKPRILAVQSMLWCMQDKMTNISLDSSQKIWLTGYYIGESSLEKEFKTENLWKGQFNDDSKSDQALLETAKTFKTGDIIVLKCTGTKGTKHDQSFLRIKGIGIITDDIHFHREKASTIGSCSVEYLNTEEKDFMGSYYGSYGKSINPLNRSHHEIVDYISAILKQGNTKSSKYEGYIRLLKANKNLVLTGAPGTGKTFLAQAIAKEMDAVTEFVQFHPSYDYTDFVEGLRPIQDKNSGQIGFERKDGVFKAFCKKAVQNLVDSRKSMEILRKEKSWESRLEEFISEAIDNEISFQLKKGNQFSIVDVNETNISILNENNPKTNNVSVNIGEILDILTHDVELVSVGDIRRYFHHKYRTQADSYTFIIIHEIRKKYDKTPENKSDPVERKDFVFIIDEINRGEVSKIFGELFYAIDPGYRETLDTNINDRTVKKVQTQYQNLVPENDIFTKGFFVPNNVYILATMNDIDRSVESMDFAMRRRFTWKEITPDETEDMLDNNIDKGFVTEAKERMHSLNAAIGDETELGAAYMIGPSYFLKLKGHNNSFNDLWSLHLEPLLKEYLRGVRKSKEIMTKFHKAYFEEGIKEKDSKSSDE